MKSHHIVGIVIFILVAGIGWLKTRKAKKRKEAVTFRLLKGKNAKDWRDAVYQPKTHRQK